MYLHEELAYLELARRIISEGVVKSNERTGVGTHALFGQQLKFDIAGHRLPVVTTRKVNPMHPIIEMLWFIAGDTDVRFLKENNINIWDSWVLSESKEFDEDGKLVAGSIGSAAYGALWRHWPTMRVVPVSELGAYIARGFHLVQQVTGANSHYSNNMVIVAREEDQLADAIELINHNPDSRRIIVNAWNPSVFDLQALPCCHFNYQFFTYDLSRFDKFKLLNHKYSIGEIDLSAYDVNNDGTIFEYEWAPSTIEAEIQKHRLPTKGLKLLLRCRSQDYLVGTVYNIIQYAALAHMVAQVTNTWATELIWQSGDTHIYSDQIEIFKTEQSSREPLGAEQDIRLIMNPDVKDIDDFKVEDLSVTEFKQHPFIKYPVAV